MKKILCLLILLILLSGCSVQYNAFISKDTVNESIVTNGKENTLPIPAYFNEVGATDDNIKIEGVEYYDITENNNGKIIQYDFPFNRYVDSKALNTCYKSVKLTKMDDDSYIINTSSYNYCYEFYDLEDITINLTFNPTDFIVTSSNADIVKDNTYTWQINENNYQNKYMQVIFKSVSSEEPDIKPDNPSEPTTPPKENSKYTALIILGAFLSLGLIIGVICFVKSRKL